MPSNPNTNTNYYHSPSFTSGLSIAGGTGVSAMYVPYATASQYGVVKPGAVRTSSISCNSASTTSGRYYLVEMDSNGKLFTNVPWSNTVPKVSRITYTTATLSNTSMQTVVVDMSGTKSVPGIVTEVGISGSGSSTTYSTAVKCTSGGGISTTVTYRASCGKQQSTTFTIYYLPAG